MLVAAEGAAAVVLLVDAGLQEAKTGRLARKGQARVQRSPTVQVSVAEAAGAVEGVVGEAGKATLPADRGSMTGMMPLDGGMPQHKRHTVQQAGLDTGCLAAFSVCSLCFSQRISTAQRHGKGCSQASFDPSLLFLLQPSCLIGMSRRSVTALAKATGVLKLRRSPSTPSAPLHCKCL